MYTNRFRLVIIVLVILVVVLSLLLLIKNEESSSATVYYIVNNSKTDSAFYESQSESIATSAVGSSSQKTIASIRASEALPTFAKTYNSIARPMHTNGNVLIVVRPLDQSKGAQLILVKPGGENQTIHTLDPGVMVSDVVVSPDDSRVAVETLSDSVQHILILDMTRPQVLLRLDGRDPVWQVSTPALK